MQLGVEPWTSCPSSGLNEAIKKGTARVVKAGESVRARVMTTVLVDIPEVETMTNDGNVKCKRGSMTIV